MLTGKNMSSFGQYNAGFILECRLWAFKFGILKTINIGLDFRSASPGRSESHLSIKLKPNQT